MLNVRNGSLLVKGGAIQTSCACCGWTCYAPDAGACLEPNGTGYTCAIKQQCECNADDGEIFLGVGQSCGCGCLTGSSVPAAIRIRSTSVEDLVIENAEIAAAPRAALQALDFTAPITRNLVNPTRYGYEACLFNNAAGWDVWLFYDTPFSCTSSTKAIRLVLTIGRASESPVADGGYATVFDFNAPAGGEYLLVPCIGENQTFVMSFPVFVVPVGLSKLGRCGVISGNTSFLWNEPLQAPRIGRRNHFTVTLEFTWIAINPLP